MSIKLVARDVDPEEGVMLRSDYTTYTDTLDCLVPFLSNPYTVAHVRSSDFLVASLYDTI